MDGSVCGMVWCGDLDRRRNSIGEGEKDEFTPVVRKKRNARTAQFSSSPEEIEILKSIKKKTKKNLSRSEG